MTQTFTHPSVIKGIADGASWADPTMDPTEIDWTARLATAAIPFKVRDGRPVNPCEQTRYRYGRNEMGHWGEALAADALVVAYVPDGRRWVLMVERDDGHGWAVPGGHVDPGEAAQDAAVRELAEETGLTPEGAQWASEAPRYVPDPRASDEAWMVTVVVTADLGEVDCLPAVAGGDDAARAAWILADTYDTLTGHLSRLYNGEVFPAHVDLLREYLA